MSKKQITYSQRKEIEACLKNYMMVTKIAEKVGISNSALYIELRRGASPEHKPHSYYIDYSADRAQAYVEKMRDRIITDEDRAIISSELAKGTPLYEICKKLCVSREKLITELKRGGSDYTGKGYDVNKILQAQYHHGIKSITYKDRLIIEDGVKKGKRVPRIAAELGCHRSTIYRELKRVCEPPYTDYTADAAQKSLFM